VALTLLTWLSGPSAPDTVKICLFAASAGMMGYGLAPAILASLKARRRKMLPLITLCVALAVAGFAIYWLVLENKIDSRSSPTVPSTTAISVGCHTEMLPKTFSANEIIRVAYLFPTPIENGGGGFGELSNHSGKEWQWRLTSENNPFGGTADRCEITNYSNVPIFDFEMFFDLSFYNAVTAPDNSVSLGEMKLRRP
jgi:hypothetical protein